MANISQIKTPDNTIYDINAKTVNGHRVLSDVPPDADMTPYSAGTGIDIDNHVINAKVRELTQAQYDALTPAEQNNGTTYFITDGQGGGGNIDDVYVDGISVVDSNKIAQIDLTSKADISSLATVATSGSYDDLSNKPNIYTQTEVDNLLSDKQDSLYGGNIASGDLNDYYLTGNYYISSATNVGNVPVSSVGILEVVAKEERSGVACVQRFSATTGAGLTGAVYERIFINGAWHDWKLVCEGSFVPIADGIKYSGTINNVDLDDKQFRTSNARDIYWLQITANTQNAPVGAGNHGILECYHYIQRFTRYNSNGSGEVYVRMYVNNTWTPWKMIGEDVYLPLTGGTITGNLRSTKTAPAYYGRVSNLTLDTSANNGITSGNPGARIEFEDSNGEAIGRVWTYGVSSGSINTQVTARNMKTDGSFVSNALQIGVSKAGNPTFSFSNSNAPSAFRSAIGINDSPTLSSKTSWDTLTLPSGTTTTLGSVTLAAGTWQVNLTGAFAANATGSRAIMLTSSSTSTSSYAGCIARQQAVNSSSVSTILNCGTCFNLTSSTTLYVRAYQGSGASMDMSSCGFRAVRINPV